MIDLSWSHILLGASIADAKSYREARRHSHPVPRPEWTALAKSGVQAQIVPWRHSSKPSANDLQRLSKLARAGEQTHTDLIALLTAMGTR